MGILQDFWTWKMLGCQCFVLSFHYKGWLTAITRPLRTAGNSKAMKNYAQEEDEVRAHFNKTEISKFMWIDLMHLQELKQLDHIIVTTPYYLWKVMAGEEGLSWTVKESKCTAWRSKTRKIPWTAGWSAEPWLWKMTEQLILEIISHYIRHKILIKQL